MRVELADDDGGLEGLFDDNSNYNVVFKVRASNLSVKSERKKIMNEKKKYITSVITTETAIDLIYE